MKLKALFVSLLALSLLGLFPTLANAECGLNDAGICDTVRIGCPIIVPTIVPGDSFWLPIYVWNDEDIYGLTIGLKFDSTELEIGKYRSYDTTGSAIPLEARAYISEKKSLAGMYLFCWVDFTSDPPYNPVAASTIEKAQLLIKIKFKVKSTATPKTIMIDSTFVPPAGKFILATETGVSLYPQYVHCPQGDIFLGDVLCGDADGSGNVDISDIVYMVNYIFKGGPAPLDASGGDVDCDQKVTIADVVYFVNYIFRGGLPPCFECW